MRKAITLAMTLAVAMCFSQCKKNVEPLSTAAGDGVRISLSVDGGKHDVFPTTGAVVYGDGDVIYVGHNGKYVGSLTYANGTFSGTINPDNEADDYLHFYFTGGLETGTLTAGTTESFTVSIADQSSKLPVLSYGHSTAKYSSGTTSYSATLLNKCVLVKFVPATATDEAVTVGGMKTEATINFATPGIIPTATTGTITLNPVSDDAKWAILLPQDAVEDPTVTINGYTCSLASVPAITENAYLNTGLGITMAGTGCIAGVFSISDDSGTTVRQVYFSKGNLYYTNGAYAFQDDQWGYVNSSATSGTTYDKFAQSVAQGYTGASSSSISGFSRKWYNLTDNEWCYLLNIAKGSNSTSSVGTRKGTASGWHYSKAVVHSVNGLVILPDGMNTTNEALLPNHDAPATDFAAISDEDWSTLEAAGCVFLPCAGHSSGGLGTGGGYWSSTSGNRCLDFSSGNVYSLNNYGRSESVRLAVVVE